jgi:hypothetical protein
MFLVTAHSIKLVTLLYNVVKNIMDRFYKVIYRLNPIDNDVYTRNHNISKSI